MRLIALMFFSFFLCNFAHASFVRKSLGLEYFKNIIDIVASKQKAGHNHRELHRFVVTSQHLIFSSKKDHFDLQSACMYILLGEEIRNEQTGVCAYEKKAISCLAMYNTKDLRDPYQAAAERIVQHDKPWERSWAPQYEFLKKF